MRAFIGLNWEESKMPRVYTTLLKVTRIRLRISMTDCASLTSVCVAVADDAILTCSAAGSFGVAETAGCNQADDLWVVFKGVGDGMVGIPVSASARIAFADLHPTKHRQLRAIAQRARASP